MNNIKSLVRKNILNLAPYSSARDEFSGSDGIFLDANENPFGQYNRYPDPYQKDLKQKLSIIKGVSEDEIFIGNGSDEAIDLLFRIFCEPNKDTCMIFTPTYGMYEVSAAINAVDVLKINTDSKFEIDLNEVKAIYTERPVKLTFICNPNNPTGNAISKEKIEGILKISNGIVVIDEAYIDFCKDLSSIDLINQYPNLIILQTMSKAWGLAGARIGFAFANKETIKLFNAVKPPYNVSALNAQAALNQLTNLEEFENNKVEILNNKQSLTEEIRKLDDVKTIYPSQTNFLLVEFNDANWTYNMLVEKGIIVRNRNSVIRNCIRITIGNKEENQKLIKALNQLQNEKSTIY